MYVLLVFIFADVFVLCLSSIVSSLTGPVTQTTFNMLLQSKCSHWKNNMALMNGNIDLQATFQPTCNVGKLVKMAFNGQMTMPRQSMFINTRSLHIQDSLTNLSDYEYILSVAYHLLFDIMYYECSLERLVIYTYITLHLHRKFGVSKSCIDFCQHVVDTVITKNKTAGKNSNSIDSKCNLHRLCYDSVISIFSLVESLPLQEYLESLLENHDKTKTDADFLSPLSSFVCQTSSIDDDFVKLLLLLKQRLKQCSMQGEKWESIKLNVNRLSHLCSLDGKAVSLLEESCANSGVSLSATVFGSHKFTCSSIVDACMQFKTDLWGNFDAFKKEVLDKFKTSYNGINKQRQFEQMLGCNYQLWKHWQQQNSAPSDISIALLEYVVFGETKALTKGDYDYIFGSCMQFNFDHNWKCTASSYGKKYKLEHNYNQLMKLVFGKMVVILTLSHCTPIISKPENRKDGLHKVEQLLQHSFTQTKVDESGNGIEVVHQNPWFLLEDKHVWDAACRWEKINLHDWLPPVLVSLCNICGQYQQNLNPRYLRCIEIDKDYAKVECMSSFLNDKTEDVVMPSVQDLEKSVQDYDNYRGEIQSINLGVTRDQQAFNALRADSVDILDSFRDSQTTVLQPLQVYGNEMMKVHQQRQDCWIKTISFATSDCFGVWSKVKHYFGRQAQLPVSGIIQTVAAVGQQGPEPFKKRINNNGMVVNVHNFGGVVDNVSESESDGSAITHVPCGDWSKMLEYHEKHISNAMELILEFIRANLAKNIMPVDPNTQVFLLEAYCKVIQDACGNKYQSIFASLNQHYSDSNGNLIKTLLKEILNCLLVFKKHAKFGLYVTNFVALVWRLLIFNKSGQQQFYDLCMFYDVL